MKRRYNADHQIRSLDEIYQIAEDLVKKYGPYKISVAGGEDIMGLGGLALGKKRGLVEPILIGHKRHIRESFYKLGISPDSWQIIPEKDYELATKMAASQVMNGEADVLMRGKPLAREFIKALMAPELKLKKRHESQHKSASASQCPLKYRKNRDRVSCEGGWGSESEKGGWEI